MSKIIKVDPKDTSLIANALYLYACENRALVQNLVIGGGDATDRTSKEMLDLADRAESLGSEYENL